MAERIKPINIRYQAPSDVAGLAGQRAAQTEFQIASENRAQKMDEAQRFVSNQLAAQEMFSRIASEQKRLQLAAHEADINERKLGHQIASDNVAINHKIRMDNAQLQMDQSLLPHEVARMEAELESKLIDNEYAREAQESAIAGQLIV